MKTMNRIDAKPGQDEHVSALDRLPDEILVPIVRLVQRRSPPEVDTPRNTWSRMMLVSNRMRTLIVETPSLWCCINNSWHPRWVELCVERSADYPLEVILGVISLEASALARAILPRNCDAVIYTARNFALVEIMLKRPGLQLRSLHLDALELFGAALAVTWSLDVRLFGGYSASLVHLTVESASIEGLPDLPCLRHINFRRSNWAAGPSLAAHLSQHTPQLVGLNIECIIILGYVFTDKYPSPVSVPSLPFLASVIIKDTHDTIRYMLRDMPVPSHYLEVVTYGWDAHGCSHAGSDHEEEVYRVETWCISNGFGTMDDKITSRFHPFYWRSRIQRMNSLAITGVSLVATTGSGRGPRGIWR
jgi:hypothetical protein